MFDNRLTRTQQLLRGVRHVVRNPQAPPPPIPHGDYFVSLDPADGYYTLGIREEDRDFFTVNYMVKLWRLACLPMG
jgi:hypothetical protein